jgi:hypothetical protein
MTIIMKRRSFLAGIGALFVAPAIIKAESLMPIRSYELPVPDWCPPGWLPLDGREISKKFYPDLYRAYEHMRLPMTVGLENTEGQRTATLISYRDLKRSSGQIMKAGVHHTIILPEPIHAA